MFNVPKPKADQECEKCTHVVCVRIHGLMYMQMHMCVAALLCVHVCGGWRSTLDINPRVLFMLFLWEQVLLLSWCSILHLGCRPSDFHVNSEALGVQVQPFTCVLGMEPWSACLGALELPSSVSQVELWPHEGAGKRTGRKWSSLNNWIWHFELSRLDLNSLYL